MLLLLTTFTYGLVLSLLALGVFISYRIFDVPDLTTDGSFATGAAISLSCIVSGMHPAPAILLGAAGGVAAGSLTGLLHARLGINKLLSGIIMMTALYSVNLHIMGASAVVLVDEPSLRTIAEELEAAVFPASMSLALENAVLPGDEIIMLAITLVTALTAAWLLHRFFQTHLGLAVRSSGENPRMSRALGVNAGATVVIGLAAANGLTALSGAIWAQLQGATDAQIGIGMIVNGLTSVIVGQALAGKSRFGVQILCVIAGCVLIRLLITGLFALGVPSTDFKIINAVFLALALALPRLMRRNRG